VNFGGDCSHALSYSMNTRLNGRRPGMEYKGLKAAAAKATFKCNALRGSTDEGVVRLFVRRSRAVNLCADLTIERVA
jgi:hypothetical protein